MNFSIGESKITLEIEWLGRVLSAIEYEALIKLDGIDFIRFTLVYMSLECSFRKFTRRCVCRRALENSVTHFRQGSF